MQTLIDPLESRQLFSAFTASDRKKLASVNDLASGAGASLFLDHNDTLIISGTTGKDRIAITESADDIEVMIATGASASLTDAGYMPIVKRLSSGSVTVASTSSDTVFQTFAPGVIQRIRVDGGTGHDEMTLPLDWNLVTYARRVETRTTVFSNGTTSTDLARAPLAGVYDGSASEWLKRFKAQKASLVGTKPKTIFFGDSLVQRMPTTDPTDWATLTKTFGATNLGFSGDTTSQALYRIANGVLHKLSPKLVFISIGTNNINLTDDVTSTVRGVESVVTAVQQQLPNAKIVLSSILPRYQAGGTDIAIAVNKQLAKHFKGSAVQFADATSLFIDPATAVPDFVVTSVHLNAAGYSIWDAFIDSQLKLALANV